MFDAVEPNNIANDEDCIEVRVNRLWNDMGCTANRAYVCECDGARMPSPPLWCDTRSDENCGTSGTVCTGSDTCNQQVCSDPS